MEHPDAFPPPPVFVDEKPKKSKGGWQQVLFVLCIAITLGILVLVCYFLELFKESVKTSRRRGAAVTTSYSRCYCAAGNRVVSCLGREEEKRLVCTV